MEQVQRTIRWKKARTVSDTPLFVSGSKAGRGFGRGEGRGGTNKGKRDSRGRSERLSWQAQAKLACNHCRTPGRIRPNCPERQCFKRQGWGHEAVSCPSKVPTWKENGKKIRRTNQLWWR